MERRGLGFYTTIISFYLVVYYSTVSARLADLEPPTYATSQSALAVSDSF